MEGGGRTAWHWRQALALAAQIPPDEADAWQVLDCMEEILQMTYRAPPPPPSPPIVPDGSQLVRFPGPRRPKRRSTSNGNPSNLPK
jgi:hypothetical protein